MPLIAICNIKKLQPQCLLKYFSFYITRSIVQVLWLSRAAWNNMNNPGWIKILPSKHPLRQLQTKYIFLLWIRTIFSRRDTKTFHNFHKKLGACKAKRFAEHLLDSKKIIIIIKLQYFQIGFYSTQQIKLPIGVGKTTEVVLGVPTQQARDGNEQRHSTAPPQHGGCVWSAAAL